MKVIDLLVKIANEDEIPEIVKYDDYLLTYDEDTQDYYNEPSCTYSLLNDIHYKLNDEVEIIEDTPKKIEHIHLANIPEERRWFTFRDKINEIIDKINEDSNERDN